MSKVIDSFKVESYGTVELTVRCDRGEITHKYWSVPKSIIKKLVSASKQPDLKDFEEWIAEHNKRKEKDDSLKYTGCNFWEDND